MQRMPLNTYENAQRSFSRLIREYNQDRVDRDKFRDLVYGMSQLLGYYRLSLDTDVEQRLEEIEDALEMRRGARRGA